jgi:predicted AAA+ superfamily ATPase
MSFLNLAFLEFRSINTSTIDRRLFSVLNRSLTEAPAVAFLGPRQVGKTTLALEVAKVRSAVYLDLESEADRAKLTEPELYLPQHEDKLVILDEIQRVPQLFQSLRGIIDAGRRRGRGKGRFLVLGSASMDLLEQSSESLAGRIRNLELSPLDAGEVGAGQLDVLWQRGGVCWQIPMRPVCDGAQTSFEHTSSVIYFNSDRALRMKHCVGFG